MSEPAHFGDATAELRAAFESCILVDRSELARLLATGPDLLDLLHRLSTADLAGLSAGEGKPTMLTTPKGRVVERLFVHHLGETGVLLIGGAGSGAKVLEHLARYTFAEQTGLAETTGESCQLALIGPRAGRALEASGLKAPAAHRTEKGRLAGIEVQLLGQDGLSTEGFSVVGRSDEAAALRSALEDAVGGVGGRPAGADALESYRVLRGLPEAGHELTEAHNPLEAGLWDAVSFDKGCYVGQEVVARLNTYDKVARSIVGLELPPGSDLPEPGATLSREGRAVGELTSVVHPPGRERPAGLGYVKRKEIEVGVSLEVAPDLTALLVELPFEIG